MAAQPRRKKLKELRANALKTAPEIHGVAPEEVMVEVLERTTSLLRVAAAEADKLAPDKMWITTIGGPMPHEWIRMEQDLRQEACFVAGRMLGLDIANRRVLAAERMAEVLAPIFKAVLDDLNLTAAQKKRVPQAVRGGLQLLEGGRT